MEQTDLQKRLRVGARFTCEIDGVKCEGKLQCKKGNEWYLCQNIKDCSAPEDKLGYKYGWIFYRALGASEIGSDITNLVILDDELEEREWKEGDILTNSNGHMLKILGIVGLCYLISTDPGFCYYSKTVTKSYILGYKLYTEPKRVTITEDQAKEAYSQIHNVDKRLIDIEK